MFYAKNIIMIDTKSKLILKILAQECGNGNYKIVEIPDIIMALPKHYRLDSEAVRHVLTYLERQDLISIKYDDDDIFCLAVLPFGFETLENDKSYRRPTKKEKKFSFQNFLLCFLSALFGGLISTIVCYFLLKYL